MINSFTALLIGTAFAQPAHWPLLAKLPNMPDQGALRGLPSLAMDWTPASSVDGQQVVDPTVGKDFLVQVEKALGSELLDRKQGSYAVIEKILRPTFESIEKNEYGNLGHTAVRYALHRLFVARHGWMIKGLDPAGQHFNSSSPVQVFNGKVPIRVQGLFEKRLGGKGFGLEELVVFGSLLEKLISQEAGDRLAALYEKFHFDIKKKVGLERMKFIVEVYMTAFILGGNISSTDAKDIVANRNQMWNLYSPWADVKQFVYKIRAEVLGAQTTFTFSDIEAVLVRFGETFGQWQNFECVNQKKKLMELEGSEKGCVPISSFYKPMLSSNGQNWQFSETPEYLAALGIVDNSDQKNIQVMVPNYLNAPSNCIATSQYYFICCVDECESLLGHVERHVQGPTARPNEIAAFISRLPSSTEPANRTLTSLQLRRLESIAEQHDGRVPVHGRLFMQWMHSIYPRECAYPHLSGTTQSLSADQWFSATGQEGNVSLAELKAKFSSVSNSTSHAPTRDGQCGDWQEAEELVVGPYKHTRSLHELETDVHTWVAASSVALLCALASIMLAVISTFKTIKSSLRQTRTYRHGFMMI
jgi:hypothetical protein